MRMLAYQVRVLLAKLFAIPPNKDAIFGGVVSDPLGFRIEGDLELGWLRWFALEYPLLLDLANAFDIFDFFVGIKFRHIPRNLSVGVGSCRGHAVFLGAAVFAVSPSWIRRAEIRVLTKHGG
jgi:hypothetical protein